MPGTVPSDQDYIDPRRDIVSCAVFGEFDSKFPAVVFYILPALSEPMTVSSLTAFPILARTVASFKASAPTDILICSAGRILS